MIRNPIDIIKSFLKLCNDFPDFYINKQYNLLDKTTLYRSESEEKIDIITNKDTLFDSCCYAYKNLKNNSYNIKTMYLNANESQKTIFDICANVISNYS